MNAFTVMSTPNTATMLAIKAENKARISKSKEDAKALDATVLAAVEARYLRWKESGSKEPMCTVAVVASTSSLSETARVRASLKRLTEDGKLTRRTVDWCGKDVFAYAPAHH